MATAEDSWFRIGLYFLLIPFILQQAILNTAGKHQIIAVIVVIWIVFCSLCILAPHWIGEILYKIIHKKDILGK